jgi:protein SCO1/2
MTVDCMTVKERAMRDTPADGARRPGGRRVGRTPLILLSLVLLPMVAIAVALWTQRASNASELPVLWRAPSFALRDQHDRVVTDGDLRGRVVVTNFIFTRCTDVCPIYLMPKMRELQRLLRERGIDERQVQLVSFTVDPEYDTPAVLADYGARFGVDPALWRLLTGPRQEMEQVASGFAVPMAHTHTSGEQPGAASAQPLMIVHSTRFMLLDRQWQLRALYPAEEVPPAEMARDIEALLRERGGPS